MKMLNGGAQLTPAETEMLKQILSKEIQSLNMLKGIGLPMDLYDSDKLKKMVEMYDLINNQDIIEGE